jgi:methionyl-tRNA synthetase
MDQQPNLPKTDNLSHAVQPPTTITIDQFLNTIQLKTAKIVSVTIVPNKDKLYQLELEVGNEKRTIVSGIRSWYPNPEELVGKMIPILYNLEPKKLGGVMSQGMLLAALDDEGQFSLLVAEKPVKSGAEVR